MNGLRRSCLCDDRVRAAAMLLAVLLKRGTCTGDRRHRDLHFFDGSGNGVGRAVFNGTNEFTVRFAGISQRPEVSPEELLRLSASERSHFFNNPFCSAPAK